MEITQEAVYVQDRRRVGLTIFTIYALGLLLVAWLAWRELQTVSSDTSALLFTYPFFAYLTCGDILFFATSLKMPRFEFYDDRLIVVTGVIRNHRLEVEYQDLFLGKLRDMMNPWFSLYEKSKSAGTQAPPSTFWPSASSPWAVFDKKFGKSQIRVHEWLLEKGVPIASENVGEAERNTYLIFFRLISGRLKYQNSKKRRFEVFASISALVLGSFIIDYSLGSLSIPSLHNVGIGTGAVILATGFFGLWYNSYKAEREYYEIKS